MKEEKYTNSANKKWYKRWWVWLIILFIVGGLLNSQGTEEKEIAAQEVNTEEAAEQAKAAQEKADKEAARKAEAAAKKQAEKEAKEKKEAEISAFIASFDKSMKPTLIESSSGVIEDVTIEHSATFYRIDVYVKESAWASSSESEKESFATTISGLIKRVAPDSYVDFKSGLNGDTVAKEKMLGGYSIKR